MRDYDPLKHYNIDFVNFENWVESTFYDHLKPLASDFYINDHNFQEAFFIREGDENYTNKESAIKMNLIISQIAALCPDSLIKTLKKETLSDKEQQFIDVCDIIFSNSEIEYLYGIPILLIKDRSDLTKKTMVFDGVSVPKIGIIINLNFIDKGDNSSILRHEFAHIIQNYRNSLIENLHKNFDYEVFMLNKLKKEFEAYITDYELIGKHLGGIDMPMQLIYSFMGIEFKPSKTVDSRGWKRTNDPKNQELRLKERNRVTKSLL